MRKPSLNFNFLAVGLLAATLTVISCKKEVIEEPIEYNFGEEIGEVTLETTPPETPEATVAVEATFTEAPAAAAASAALANGEATAEMQTAAAAIDETKAAELSAAFTPEVEASLASGGTLPAELQAQIDAMLATGALAAFLPSSTAPTVDGESVRKGYTSPKIVSQALDLNQVFLGISDACTDAALAAYNEKKTELDALKAAQDAPITAAYTAQIAAIDATYAASAAATTAKYAALKAEALATKNANIAAIDAAVASGKFSSALGNIFKGIQNVVYAVTLQVLNSTEAKQKAADLKVQVKSTEKAAKARDNALTKVQNKYDAELTKLTNKYQALTNTCHDQGGGQ